MLEYVQGLEPYKRIIQIWQIRIFVFGVNFCCSTFPLVYRMLPMIAIFSKKKMNCNYGSKATTMYIDWTGFPVSFTLLGKYVKCHTTVVLIVVISGKVCSDHSVICGLKEMSLWATRLCFVIMTSVVLVLRRAKFNYEHLMLYDRATSFFNHNVYE